MRPCRRRLIVALLIAACAAGAASAQTGNGQAIYQRMDLNGDGTIDVDELAALRSRIFNRMDRDLDGNLTKTEFVDLWVEEIAQADDTRRAQLRDLQAGRFAEMDPDGDGQITKKQYLDIGAQRFSNADVNADGRLSLQEFEGANTE